jgi:hypothetical protein
MKWFANSKKSKINNKKLSIGKKLKTRKLMKLIKMEKTNSQSPKKTHKANKSYATI